MPVTTDDQPGARVEEEVQFEDRTGDGNPTVDGAVRLVSDDLVVKLSTGVKSLTAGAAGGEANTSSNVGGGAELAKAKSGVDLPFRTLVGERGVEVTEDTDTVTIAARWARHFLLMGG